MGILGAHHGPVGHGLWCANGTIYDREIYAATRYSTLQSAATHCNALQHTAIQCSTLQHITTHCHTLQPRCSRSAVIGSSLLFGCFLTLQHNAIHCIALHHTATHRITLQHTATHCNTLQHTATHCNTGAAGALSAAAASLSTASSAVCDRLAPLSGQQRVAVCCSVLLQCVAV